MANITVTTLADTVNAGDGVTSLREALALANGNGRDADTITFAAGLAGGTLFLTSGQQLAITTDGITIDGDIDGDGTPDITIDADSGPLANDAASRVFLIDGGGHGDLGGAQRPRHPGRQRGRRLTGGGIYVGTERCAHADQRDRLRQQRRRSTAAGFSATTAPRSR